MKKILIILALALADILFVPDPWSGPFNGVAFAQVTQLLQAQTVSLTGVPVMPAALNAVFENANYTGHVLTWSTSGTVSTCTVQFETSAAGVTFALMTTSAAQTCTSAGSYYVGNQTANYVRLNFTAFSGSGSVTFNYAGVIQQNVTPTDGYYVVPLQACGLTLTVGALGTSTTNQIPGIKRDAANNHVLFVTTTAAANTTRLDCDISPPSRLTAGKGVVLNDVGIFYGYQTTALTSITDATFSSVTYSAAGGAAAGTVATVGGTLTLTAGTSHSTPGAVTTAGQCYSEKVAFGTPIAVTTDLQRITLEETFAQSAAAATTLEVCGVVVHYSLSPPVF